MIPIDFEYYRPDSLQNAIQLYHDLTTNQKETFYYGGGTEIISRSRLNEITPQALIDIKGIPECNIYEKDKGNIIIGSTVSLTKVVDMPLFPLLSNVVRSIAFRTARNKITIGGNLSGSTIYREALLPFLLSDSQVVIAGVSGTRKVGIKEITQHGTNLGKDEFIVQLITNEKYTQFPFINHKTTKQSKVNYPIVSIASIKVDSEIRVAFSGVCSFPFRLESIEDILNDSTNSISKRIQSAVDKLPAPILNDMQASKEYREFVLKQSLFRLFNNVEGVFT